jgi:mono/diheme cytochrome c family protein
MVLMGLKLFVVLPIIGVMLLLGWKRVSTLTWAIAWIVALWVGFKFGFLIPIPGSVINLYMGIALLSVFAYVTSSRERQAEFAAPIVKLVMRPERRIVLAGIVLLAPLLVALNVYVKMNVPLEAPAFGRTVHPAPPDLITVHDREIDLATAVNPFRELEESDQEQFQAHLESGRRVYFENCFYCHGDLMAGDGMFAYGLNPIPTNFTDQGVLPMLQESFLFWRIAKGAPGLPEEGGPWDSAMPAWESFLTEEEMWDVILFLYDYNNYRPRALTEHH